MGEIRLDYCCRLCLKVSLTNIFSQRSASGDPIYRILNSMYEMKIFENDGLPSQICSPCMWRLIEFDACKKNVRSAEAEIVRLLSQTRPHMNEVSNHGSVIVSEDNEMDGAVEVGIEGSNLHSDATIKDEINVFEKENPIETDIKEPIPEPVQHLKETDFHVLESTEIKADEVTVEEFEDNCNEHVFCQPLRESTESSDLKNCLSLEASEENVGDSFEGESSSICTSEDIYGKNRVTNKGMPENGLRGDAVPVDESLSTQISKSILNVTKSGRSYSKAPLSKRKSGFICDICNKSFQHKVHLGKHVRVHYDDRPFSCSVCDKRFKQDSVRCRHELLHLRHKMSLGKSEKGGKKILFSCSICGKKFGSKKGLNGHSNTHSGKFKCNFCGKCFGYNSDLIFHSRNHTKEKPFKCEMCSKCFSKKYNFIRHLLSHSSDKPFPCDICEKTFKSKGGKTQHALYHLRK